MGHSYIVTRSLFFHLQEEFQVGEKACTAILGSGGRPTNWHKLFEPTNFFKRYKNYLQARVAPALTGLL